MADFTQIHLTTDRGTIIGDVASCDITIAPRVIGHHFTFTFFIAPYEQQERDEHTKLVDLEIDLHLGSENNKILIGRLLPELDRRGHDVGAPIQLKKYLDLSSEDLLRLSSRTHHTDLSLVFECVPVLEGGRRTRMSTGRCGVPQSEWLSLLNKSGMARFEFIALRTPVNTSHAFPPFSDAIDKIREAEEQYHRGHWNAAVSASRTAWHTVLSAAPQGERHLEYLVERATKDVRRRKFALEFVKGLHNLLNQGVHLEGNVLDDTPPAQLAAEDALLCIHLYSSVIGYLSELASQEGM